MKDKDGINRFNPEEVETFVESNAIGVDAMEVLVSSLRQQMAHNQTILDMSTTTVFKLLELQTQANTALYTRLAEQNKQIDSMRDLVGNAESDQQDRSIQLMKFQAAEARRDEKEQRSKNIQEKSLNTFAQYLPDMMNKITGSSGIGGGEMKEASAMLSFAKSMTAEQMERLVEDLEPEQLEILLPVIKKFTVPDSVPGNGNGVAQES